MKDRLTRLYQTLLIENDNYAHLKTLFESLIEVLRKDPVLPSNIVKAALRTMSKLLDHKHVSSELLKHKFEVSALLRALYECQLDSHDQDQEEVILMTIQRVVIQVLRQLHSLLSGEDLLTACMYFFRVHRKKAINDSFITSQHFSEGTKRNMNKVFSVVM